MSPKRGLVTAMEKGKEALHFLSKGRKFLPFYSGGEKGQSECAGFAREKGKRPCSKKKAKRAPLVPRAQKERKKGNNAHSLFPRGLKRREQVLPPRKKKSALRKRKGSRPARGKEAIISLKVVGKESASTLDERDGKEKENNGRLSWGGGSSFSNKNNLSSPSEKKEWAPALHTKGKKRGFWPFLYEGEKKTSLLYVLRRKRRRSPSYEGTAGERKGEAAVPEAKKGGGGKKELCALAEKRLSGGSAEKRVFLLANLMGKRGGD